MTPNVNMKNILLKQRLLASVGHLLFSFLMIALASVLVFYIWYPEPFAVASGVTKIVLMLFSIDLVLGPLVTFIIYKSDKKHFIKDLSVILLVQIMALTYGLYTLHQGRPVWAVFVIDDIELISPASIHLSNESDFKKEYHYRIFQKPTLVGASYSTDGNIAQKQKEAEMFQGVSLAARPETYHSINLKKNQILKTIKKIDELYKFNDAKNVNYILLNYPNISGYLPVKGFDKDIVALVDQEGVVLKFVDLNPWSITD